MQNEGKTNIHVPKKSENQYRFFIISGIFVRHFASLVEIVYTTYFFCMLTDVTAE